MKSIERHFLRLPCYLLPKFIILMMLLSFQLRARCMNNKSSVQDHINIDVGNDLHPQSEEIAPFRICGCVIIT